MGERGQSDLFGSEIDIVRSDPNVGSGELKNASRGETPLGPALTRCRREWPESRKTFTLVLGMLITVFQEIVTI